MKKTSITIAVIFGCLCSTPLLKAQSAIDALQLTQSDFKGTARFMSMGGAFTALGGDLSAINVNPGGIAVYRSSEIGVSLDLDFQNAKGKSPGITASDSQTKFYCNNFGYVGTTNLKGAMETFSWGVTYNRQVSFDRRVSGRAYPVGTSLTNYIAAFTNGIEADDLTFYDDYNPYLDSNIDWLSILAYSSYLINTPNGMSDRYLGLYHNGTESDAEMSVLEKGYVDNYQFTFGGNVSNLVYWGLGIGVNDLRYVRQTYYSESMSDALVYSNSAAGTTPGSAEYALYNNKVTSGTGWNISFGVILRPIQELRIGASIKSPTWYNISESYIGSVDYWMQQTNSNNVLKGTEYTDEAYFNWKLRSPWRFNIGAAAVLGTKAIISLDYERVMYNDMTMKTALYNNWGNVTGYQDAEYLNDDIRAYTQNANNIRVGLEYRVTPKVSARLGYNVQLTNISSEYADGTQEIFTAGTDPSFSLDKTTNYITAGLGYKFSNFYADLTYVHKTAKSSLHPYTSYGAIQAPAFDITQNNNSFVLSLGYKF
ncbi:MAG: hypothetical protein J1F20_03050 [Muribaculaceae bacterium]|nr:hypothetical protein [Muribaculaceae bacterium]